MVALVHPDIGHVIPARRNRRRWAVLRFVRRQPVVAIAAGYIVLVVLIAVFAPLLAPHDPYRSNFGSLLSGPSSDYLVGTDKLGRDQLSRLFFGARTSIVAALMVLLVSLGIGTPLGLLAGYLGGRVDNVLSRMVDGIMSVPGITLALAFIAVLGPGLRNGMLAIGIVTVPRFFRVVRASTIDTKHETFIEASVALGCSKPRIVLGHILPNITGPLLVQMSLTLGTAVLAEASLSFLGLGAQIPEASWGQMLTDAASRMDLAYLFWPPAIALVLTIGSFTILGDAIRDRLLGVRRD